MIGLKGAGTRTGKAKDGYEALFSRKVLQSKVRLASRHPVRKHCGARASQRGAQQWPIAGGNIFSRCARGPGDIAVQRENGPDQFVEAQR